MMPLCAETGGGAMTDDRDFLHDLFGDEAAHFIHHLHTSPVRIRRRGDERNPLRWTNPRTLATTFWGRADGLYCGPKCRQQAVRNRRKAAR